MTTTAGENVLDFTRIICNKFKPKNLFAKRNYYSQVMQNAYLNEYNMMMQNGLDGSLEQQYMMQQQQQQQQQQLQLQQQQQQLVYQQQMNQINQANQVNQLNQIKQMNEINQRNQLNQLNQVGQVNPNIPLNPNVSLNPNVIIQPSPVQNQFQIAPQPLPAAVNQFAPNNTLLNPTIPPIGQTNAIPLSPMMNNQSPMIAQPTLPRNRPAYGRPMPKSNELSKSGNDPDLDELDPGKAITPFCLPFTLSMATFVG